MEHYICKGGCQAISEKPGTCQDPNCPNYGKPLEECDCVDSKHGGAFEEPDDEKEKENGGV